ncbi:DUF3035 domain-containing protein [Candidatus Pelagibacter bacterium]|nr:DUF3035 domain-containing protein [Candidatus Pelagibacter bacterium]
MKKILLTLFIPLILMSCASFEDAAKVLRNEKIKSTDEFLVKKKEPLVLPPDFNKIPEPGSLSKKKDGENENRIKKILKVPSTNKTKKNNSSSVEDTIIDRIRK